MTVRSIEACKVALRLVRRRPLTWTLQLVCKRPLPRFVYPFFVCGLAHFQYCKRKDHTRNLVVDSLRCDLFDIRCVGSRDRCEKELYNALDEAANALARDAEAGCHIECFGVEADEYGLFVSVKEIEEYCCYHRCDENWRCDVGRCIFSTTEKPGYVYRKA